MNTAQKMRELALKNIEVKEAYKQVLTEIKESAENGDLLCEIYNDPTILVLLNQDGFSIENTHLDKVIVKW